MNRNQRIVIGFGLMFMLLMVLYPPYNLSSVKGGGEFFFVFRSRYGFLFDPPARPFGFSGSSFTMGVNWSRLANQWLIVLIPTMITFWAFKRKSK